MEGGDKEEDIQPKSKKRKWIKPYKGNSVCSVGHTLL